MSRYNRFRNSLSGYTGRGTNPFATDDSFGNSLKNFGGNIVSSGLFSKFCHFVEELGIAEGIENLWKGTTGSGLTKRDIELNQMNMQNVEDTAAAQVAGYQKAGINPALMYGAGGQQSAPQTASTGTGSLSDLMQVLMLPSQLKMIQAQTRNIEANSQKTLADTEQVKLALKYYPSLTEKTIAEISSRIDLNAQNISESEAREQVAKFEAILKETESKYADVYFDLRNQGEAAKRDAALESAAESAARAAWTEFETEWTREHNGARPSSSSLLALIEALSSWLGVDDQQQGIVTRAVQKVVKNPPKPEPFYNDPDSFEKNKSKPLPRLFMRARRAIRGRGLVLD